MSKITLNDISAQNSVTTASTTINNNNDTIETAFDNTLSRDGTNPNQMSSDFDMNSYRILNLPAPVNADEPLRYQDLSTFIGGGTVTNIPSGGNTNDVLAKASNTNYDIHWSSASSEIAAGANISVTGASPATIATTQNPNFTTSITTPSLVLNGTTLNSKTGTGAVVLATSPAITTPTGIVKGDVGLGNVDNTSDATKNTAVATLINKTLTAPVMTAPVLGTPASGVATNLIGTASGLTAGSVTTNANLTGPITSVGNATSVASQTGTGTTFVMNTSPTLVTPALGTPSSVNLTNATSLPVLTGISGFSAGIATFLNTASSSNLAAAMTDETGSGSVVFATSPTLVTPALGTPSSVVLTNATGTAASLTAGTVTTNANLTGAITSAGNATSLGSFTSASLKTALTDETGSGSAVFATSPALTTPTGIVKNDVGLGNVDNTSDTTKWAATKTLTNTTYDTAGTGNSFSINSVAATGNTGTGLVVRATTPTLVTPVLGAATATTINGAALDNLAWTSYTPTITSSIGTPTTTSATGRYKQIGKLILMQADVTITTVGTALGSLRATIPVTSAAFAAVGSSAEVAVTGKSGASFMSASGTFVSCSDATNTTYWVAGNRVVICLVYEAA